MNDVETTARYNAAIAALRADVWQEEKRGLRPFDGLQAHASWLTISQEGDVVGWDMNRAARLAVDASEGMPCGWGYHNPNTCPEVNDELDAITAEDDDE